MFLQVRTLRLKKVKQTFHASHTSSKAQPWSRFSREKEYAASVFREGNFFVRAANQNWSARARRKGNCWTEGLTRISEDLTGFWIHTKLTLNISSMSLELCLLDCASLGLPVNHEVSDEGDPSSRELSESLLPRCFTYSTSPYSPSNPGMYVLLSPPHRWESEVKPCPWRGRVEICAESVWFQWMLSLARHKPD